MSKQKEKNQNALINEIIELEDKKRTLIAKKEVMLKQYNSSLELNSIRNEAAYSNWETLESKIAEIDEQIQSKINELDKSTTKKYHKRDIIGTIIGIFMIIVSILIFLIIFDVI